MPDTPSAPYVDASPARPVRERVPSRASLEAVPDRDVPPVVAPGSDSPQVVLVALTEASLHSITPRSAKHALQADLADMWIKAMQREKDCHLKNETFGRTLRPSLAHEPAIKAIPADWVFKIKHRGAPIEPRDLAGPQFKARVVVRGQFMKESLDYNDTFAPVAKPARPCTSCLRSTQQVPSQLRRHRDRCSQRCYGL